MKSVAFVFVGLAIGLLVALIVTKSGYKVSVNKVSPSSSSTENSSATGAPKASPASEITITGGGTGVFVKYTASIPNSWTSTKEVNPFPDGVILTNTGYQVKIESLAADGNVCVYPGDQVDPNNPFQIKYNYFRQLTTVDGTVLKISGDQSTSTKLVACEKKDTNYQVPTMYGYIQITIPSNSDPLKIKEIDQILSSLKKI